MSPRVKPSIFIPTLYFAEGLPYTIVNQMSQTLYKNLGATNTFIGEATSWLYWPWVVKFLWSPFVDKYGTKRKWILVAQTVLGAITAVMAATVFLPYGMYVSIAIFFVMAIASATHDIAIDGYYLDVLNKQQQAFYVGVRNAFYKVAILFGSGVMIFLAGKLAETTALGVQGGWCVAFAACAVALLGCAAFHSVALPHEDKANSDSEQTKSDGVKEPGMTFQEFFRVFRTWLDQPKIGAIVFYILSFRCGDALMLKMAQPFLLDSEEKGGLAILTSEVGIIYGTIGIFFLLLGGIVGGAIVSKYGLKKCLMPTALIQNGAITLYWWLALVRPQGEVSIAGFEVTKAVQGITSNAEILHWFDATLFYTILINSFEQFSYALGTAAYTVFLLQTVRSEYKAAHYAIATGLMAMGMMVPGFVSGRLVDVVGYETFFLISFLASFPGVISIFFLPIAKEANT